MNYLDDALLIGLTISLVQVFKNLGLSIRFAPLIAIICAMGASFGASIGQGLDTFSVIVRGLVWGLTAAGVYSSTKTTFNG